MPGTLIYEKEILERAAYERDLAQREIGNGFPLLHEQASVALWSSLEALLRSFSASWLANWPGAWQTEAIKKLRVNLGDYEALEPLDRCLWVVDMLDKEAKCPVRKESVVLKAFFEALSSHGP